MAILSRWFGAIRKWRLRRAADAGTKLSRFIARDVIREIVVVSTDGIDEGVIVARVRTWNVLYVARGFVDEPELGPPEEVEVDRLWHWSGESWGGLPDGTSIADHAGGPGAR